MYLISILMTCAVFPLLLCSGEEVRLDREKILRALLMTEL